MRSLYLKALEIQGFKSFPDKTVLSFGSDITAIVGPNGSGKSNIADAIRWVMGEQSTRTLRGSKMEDVIFDGTAKRKGLGFAEVSLVIDNSEHIFPMEETEVSVTRRYYRSGESEYYINRRSCRLKDVNELFMDTGLGREGYSIIGQGRIDEILSIKSADRREIFEEAAGISRFRHRKEEAERKLERTQENLVRINDKIDELELQVEPLRLQAEKTKKYLLLRDELKSLEISVWMEQLEKLRAGSIKLKNDYETAVRQREETRTALDALYAAVEEYAGQMRDKDVQAEGLRQEQSQLDQQIHSCESGISLLENDIRNNAANAARIREEMEQQVDRADSVAGQIRERQGRLEQIRTQMDQCQAGSRALTEKLEETVRSAGTLSQELSQLQEQERLGSASAAEAKALLSALTAAAQELLDREEKLTQELAAQEEKEGQARAAADELRGELDRVKEDRDAAKNVISGYEMRCQTRQHKLDQAQERFHRLKMDENNLNSRIKLLSEMEQMYEGYSKAVKLLMGEVQRGALRGIRGPVAGLLHVPDQYAVAIEIALGGAMQNIVVERDEDGKQAIGWLKRREAGRATFLPMNTIRPAQFQDRDVEREDGFVGMADALIDFDREYAGVFSHLLGRVVIASDLDKAMAMARKFRHRFRIVTLDGQVLNAGGSMTGGSASRSAGILSRANELERLGRQREELAGQQARLAGLEGERAALEQNLAELEQLKADLSGDSAQRTAMIAQFEQNNEALALQVGEAQNRLQELRGQSLSLGERLRRINEEKLELEGKRNRADGEARETNNQLLGMEREVSTLEQKVNTAAWEENQILDKLWETYQLSHEAARAQRVELESTAKAQRRIGELKRAISALGNINPDAVEQYEKVNERYTYFAGQRDDVTQAKKELEDIIAQITGEMTGIFRTQFALINEHFQQTFQELFRGGKAVLALEDPDDVLNCGIEIKVQPPGKALKTLSLLSGGERAFVAIALYFAILKVRPTPFCVMDEIEAALDDTNVVRFARYLRKMSGKTQFIVITHRRGTMEEADVLYGVTMQEQGVSRMLTINLNEVEEELHIK